MILISLHNFFDWTEFIHLLKLLRFKLET